MAKRLSRESGIPYYELDNIHSSGDIKRNVEEIERLFLNILKQNEWIIENVGRSYFVLLLKSISTQVKFLASALLKPQ